MSNAAGCGIAYSELMHIDYKILNALVLGSMQWRETEININKSILHNIAGKIAQANHGSKNFEKKIKDVDLTSRLRIEDNGNCINKKQIETLERIRKQYGIDLTEEV